MRNESYKICTKCKRLKLLSDFYISRGACKRCHYAANRKRAESKKDWYKQYKHNYYLANKSQLLDKMRIWQLQHKEDVKVYKNKWYCENKERLLLKRKEYVILNQGRIYNKYKERLKSDIQFKLSLYLRTRLRQAIVNNYKSGSAVRDLGCTINELKQYLESKFQDGMTWGNWGRGSGKWNIDHIIPLSQFDLSDREQFKKVCHYTNLQPLWFMDNMRKGNK